MCHIPTKLFGSDLAPALVKDVPLVDPRRLVGYPTGGSGGITIKNYCAMKQLFLILSFISFGSCVANDTMQPQGWRNKLPELTAQLTLMGGSILAAYAGHRAVCEIMEYGAHNMPVCNPHVSIECALGAGVLCALTFRSISRMKLKRYRCFPSGSR